ncbi:histone H1-III-like [Hylaeus volcanicus]|uniref:histone H1-III-like n=1 Tax=Hylaeus volcanicus TaxID=313075 RepID=UPI0023B7B500|nr:histone H1-III-like [Hylaeus volcanicus]XP_053989637.1 histone H1-III-like [Hylaeus volcanicus]
MDEKNASANTSVEMGESNSATAAKKPAKSKSKAQRAKASHPPTSEMVNAAIKELKDRKGSSVQAIKKFIASTYKVDGEKFAPFIKRYLKAAVTSGAVVQTKGKGASGSFKLSAGKPSETLKTKKELRSPKKAEVKKVEKKTVAKKVAPVKKPAAKKPVEKKAAAVKKTAAKAAATKAKTATEAKNMSKSRKTAKAPAAKTRTPKPKKTATSKSVKAPAKK